MSAARQRIAVHDQVAHVPPTADRRGQPADPDAGPQHIDKPDPHAPPARTGPEHRHEGHGRQRHDAERAQLRDQRSTHSQTKAEHQPTSPTAARSMGQKRKAHRGRRGRQHIVVSSGRDEHKTRREGRQGRRCQRRAALTGEEVARRGVGAGDDHSAKRHAQYPSQPEGQQRAAPGAGSEAGVDEGIAVSRNIRAADDGKRVRRRERIEVSVVDPRRHCGSQRVVQRRLRCLLTHGEDRAFVQWQRPVFDDVLDVPQVEVLIRRFECRDGQDVRQRYCEVRADQDRQWPALKPGHGRSPGGL